jgi:twinkle protein
MGAIVSRAPCPSCRDKGEDRTGDNLCVYEDGSGFCHKCRHYESGVTETPRSKMKSKLTVKEVLTYPVGGDPGRLIPPEILELYNIRVSHSATSGELEKVYYPYMDDPGGIYRGIKYRIIKDKDFYIVGELPGVFGKQACKGKGTLVITEGEEDALAAKVMLPSADCVSLPNGAKVDDLTRSDVRFLEKYDNIAIVLDSDIPGKVAAKELGDWLSTFTKVKVVELNEDLKDASEYLKQGKRKEFLDTIKDTQVHEPEGVINGVDISLSDLLKPIPEGYKTPYPAFNDMTLGVRKGEIITVCAGSGIGKSTLCRELTKDLIEQGCSVANVALEDQMGVAVQALMAIDMDIPLYKFRMYPPPEAAVKPSYDKLCANGRTYFYQHFAGINSDSLIDKLYYYARSKKCDFIVLDHLSLVISASHGIVNERQAIDHLMTKLAKLVVETGVGLIQVVHLKRPSGDKSFSTGGQVNLDDLRGSASLEHLSWTVVGLERDQQGESKDFSKIRVLKNRTVGFLGVADTLKYNAETGRLLPIELEEDDDCL